MKKMKRIAALISAILLIGLYLSTFIFSMFDSEFAQSLLMASVAMTILLPVLLYGILMVHKLVDKRDENNDCE